MTPRTPLSTSGVHLARAAAFAALTALTSTAHAALELASTSDVSRWRVAVNFRQPDGQASSFQTSTFQDAVAITGRTSDGIGWIANTANGSNFGSVGNWTFFVFRQELDLTGYDPATAELRFQWAGDDSGQGFADRGTWVPKFRLNGGSFQSSVWAGGSTYTFSDPVTVNSGFVAGRNVIDFYVEGNGVTDGFALKPLSFTAAPVPEASSLALAVAGMAVLGGLARRRSAPR